MSIKYLNQAFKCEEVSAMEKLVLIALCDCLNDDGFGYPGYKTLLKKTSLSKSTLAKHLGTLKKAGFFETKSHAKIGKGRKVNTYHFVEFWEIDDLKNRIAEARKAQGASCGKSIIKKHLKILENEPKENNDVIFRKINIAKFEPTIDANIAKQWITYRAGMERPITSQKTFDQQMREAIKTSEYFFGEGTITPNDVITKSIDAGWVGIGTPAWFLHRGFL